MCVCLQSQVTNTSSQDSIQEGLSPDMSDHDHSNEIDNDPREIHIPKTSSSLGEGVCVCVCVLCVLCVCVGVCVGVRREPSKRKQFAHKCTSTAFSFISHVLQYTVQTACTCM